MLRGGSHSERHLFSALKSDNLDRFQEYVPAFFSPDYQFTRMLACSCPRLHNRPPLLAVAAFYGAIHCFRYLLLQNADISKTDSAGTTVANLAVAGGDIDILNILEDAGASFQGTAFTAAETGNFEVFMWLFATREIDLTERNPDQRTVLHAAASSGNWRLINFLLQNSQDHLHLGDFHDILTLLHESGEKSSSDCEEEDSDTWDWV